MRPTVSVLPGCGEGGGGAGGDLDGCLKGCTKVLGADGGGQRERRRREDHGGGGFCPLILQNDRILITKLNSVFGFFSHFRLYLGFSDLGGPI